MKTLPCPYCDDKGRPHPGCPSCGKIKEEEPPLGPLTPVKELQTSRGFSGGL